MDNNYNCDTCSFERCNDCGKHIFYDGVRQGRQQVINWIETHNVILASGLLKDNTSWKTMIDRWEKYDGR